MAKFSDLLGTLGSYFKLGISGVRLKNSSGNLLVRNSGDSGDAEITASKLNVSGDDIVINSDAAGSSNDWTATLRRNAAQTAALAVVLPPAKGTDGHVLRQKSGTAGGVLELELVAAGSTEACETVDTTSLAHGSSSPVSMFTLPATAVVTKIQLIIDTAFNGTPSASIGIAGTTSKYMASTQIDLTATAGTIFEVHPGLAAAGSTEDLIITYSAGGASAGAARALVFYSIPQ